MESSKQWTHKQTTANYYYTGTIDNQESSQLAVSMCSGEMVSDTMSDSSGGRYARVIYREGG